MEAAFTELASDIAGIPGAADVQAEADRVSTNTATLGAAFGDFAQRLRDAIPTDAPDEPLPNPEPEPEPEPEA